MKKNILLDLGGVVFLAGPKTHPKVDWKIIARLNQKYGLPLDLGLDVFHDFIREYNQDSGLSLTGEAFLEAVFDSLEFNQALIDRLKSLGPIIIVSDNYRENIEYVSQRFRFSDWSIAQFYSYELQVFKSNPLFFKSILHNLDCAPSDLLLIDDDSGNIAAAKGEGIEGIVYKNNNQLFADLTGYSFE